MAAASFDIKDLDRRMHGVQDTLKREFSGLRTGRASASLLEPVVVTVYGAKMPLNQVATVSVPDARTISVQVWDKSQVQAVDRAIREANLGLNPIADGTLLRLEDNIVFKGLGKVAAPIASRDVRNRWATSLERLKAAVEAGE